MRKRRYQMNRMHTLPLTRLELAQFTGHQRLDKQIATLRALGIDFNVSQEGKLRVCRSDIEQFLEPPKPSVYRLRTHCSDVADQASPDKWSRQARAEPYARRSA